MKPAATAEEWARRNSADEHAQDLALAVEWLLLRQGDGPRREALVFALGVFRQFQTFFVSDYDEDGEPQFWRLCAKARDALEDAGIGAADLCEARNAAIVAASCRSYGAGRCSIASAAWPAEGEGSAK